MNKHSLSLYALLLCIASTLTAQTIYQGPANGDWFLAANWSAGLPAMGNNATIPGGTSVRITQDLTMNFTVQNFGSITNAATLSVTVNLISGGSFRNDGTMSIAANTLFTNGGGFTNTGSLTNFGTWTSSSAFANTATATTRNLGVWQQFAPLSNDGIWTNELDFSSPSVFTNNKTLTNTAAAIFKTDFGGSLINATGSSLSNAGTVQNFGTVENRNTIQNTGKFINNGLLTNMGSFDNKDIAEFENMGTVHNAGNFTNAVGAKMSSSFRFTLLNGGLVVNFGLFANRADLDVAAGALFSNEMGASLTLGFGSSITNAGLFKNKATGKIEGNGSVLNNKLFENAGLLEARDGSQIRNTDSLTNSGTMRMVNIAQNTAYWLNTGTIENNGGAVWTNTGKLENAATGTLTNGFEIRNQTTGQILNNGRLINLVRLFNDAAFINNAYLRTEGDILNQTTGTLTNSELIDISAGALNNAGTVQNLKTIVNNSCSVISNQTTGTITNSGNLRNSGVIFQKGALSGNPVQNLDGLVQIGTATNAPSVCKPLVKAGTDLQGQAKVDAPAVIAKGFGVDSCQGVLYLIDGVTRKTYNCANIGATISNIPVSIRFRTNDELTCTTTVEVFDDVAPSITNCPANVLLVTDQTTAIFTWASITATDNCGATPSFTTSHPSGTAFPLGLTEVIVQATDNNANTGECRFKVQVQQGQTNGTCTPTDATAPVFSNCPQNISITTTLSGATAFWTAPSVSDNCLPIQVRATHLPGQFFLSGNTIVHYTATDAKGNTATCSFTVSINGNTDPCTTDAIKPVLTNCPTNFISQFNPAINGAIAVWMPPSVSDNCSTPTLTATAVSGSIFPLGSTTVTYTATDARNNSATCAFIITVSNVNPCPNDATPPFVSNCPANQDLTTDTESRIVTWSEPSATDDCSTVSSSQSHVSGSLLGLGETTVVYQFSDLAGNKAVCVFKITVQNPCLVDVVRPTINCPADITVAGTGAPVSVTWTEPTASDACSTPSVSSNFQSGSNFPIGSNTIIYTAIDGNGNTATCQFKVTVTNPCTPDVTPPVFVNCPMNLTVMAQTVPAVARWTAPTATDFCGAANLTTNHNSGESFPEGVTTVIYTATDNVGNSSHCSFAVMIILDCAQDMTPPVFLTCPPNQNLTTTGTTAMATWEMPRVKDNCSIPSVSSNYLSGAHFPIGNTIVTYTARDAAGNMEVCRFNIAVVGINPCTTDTIPPIFDNCPSTIRLTTTGTNAVATWTAPTAMDNCGTPTVTSNLNSGATFQIGTTPVVYTAKDAQNNEATCLFFVIVGQEVVGTYCTAKGNEPWQEWVSRLEFAGLNNVSDKITNGNSIGYSDFTNLVARVNRSATYPLSITAGMSWLGRGNALYARAWIDFNGDGDFTDAGEMVLSQERPQAFTAMVLIPANAKMGVTRLRIAVKSGGFPSPCEIFALGEVEDYTVQIGETTNACINDTEAPVFSACPANISLTTTGSTAIAVWTTPTATDNCSIPSVSSLFSSGQAFPIGATTVIYTATDATGNRATCQFTVTISQEITGGLNDIGLTINTNLTTFQNYMPVRYTITAKNNGTQAMSHIKIQFRFPEKTVAGGAVDATNGLWEEWCAGDIRCFTWSIPRLEGNGTARLTVPLFILDATTPIVAQTQLLSSTPTDSFSENNTASVTIHPITSPQAAVKNTPPQYLPLVIQSLSPNPTDGELRVALKSLIEKEVFLDISDAAGKVVRTEKVMVEKGTNRLFLDMSVLPPGIYFILPRTPLAKGQPIKFVKV